MIKGRRTVELPAYMQHPNIWKLGEDGPKSVGNYLKWILDNPDRATSAADNLRYLKIGMHFLTIAQRFNEDGNVVDKIELNFWSEEFPPQTGAGGHAHARAPQLLSCLHPDARQTVTGITLLPPETRKLPKLPIEERRLAVLSKIDSGDGLGTSYHPLVLGNRLVLGSTTEMPARTRQHFSSLFIHEVQFQGPGASVTVQRQGPTEQDGLNTFEGFTTYKGLTKDEAAMVVQQREKLTRSLGSTADKLVASTVLVRDLDFAPEQMEAKAETASHTTFDRLAIGSIHSIERLLNES